MLSPQRAVAAASGGAGEVLSFPGARSTATPSPPPPPSRLQLQGGRGALGRAFGAGRC